MTEVVSRREAPRRTCEPVALHVVFVGSAWCEKLSESSLRVCARNDWSMGVSCARLWAFTELSGWKKLRVAIGGPSTRGLHVFGRVVTFHGSRTRQFSHHLPTISTFSIPHLYLGHLPSTPLFLDSRCNSLYFSIFLPKHELPFTIRRRTNRGIIPAGKSFAEVVDWLFFRSRREWEFAGPLDCKLKVLLTALDCVTGTLLELNF